MSDEQQRLFRKEAILAHAGAELQGEILRISPRWVPWAYRVLVAAVVTTIAFCYFGRVEEYARADAVIERDVAVASVPGKYASQVTPGSDVQLVLDGDPDPIMLRVDSVAPNGSMLVVQAHLAASHDGERGTLEIPLGTRRLVYDIFPSLEPSHEPSP